jgi:hypothetical protein
VFNVRGGVETIDWSKHVDGGGGDASFVDFCLSRATPVVLTNTAVARWPAVADKQ